MDCAFVIKGRAILDDNIGSRHERERDREKKNDQWRERVIVEMEKSSR